MATSTDYRAVAEVLARELANCTTTQERQRVEGITHGVANYFSRQNPRFIRARFYTTVGVTFDAPPPVSSGVVRLREAMEATITAMASEECTFWACKGPDVEPESMLTCSKCWHIHDLRAALAGVPSG